MLIFYMAMPQGWKGPGQGSSFNLGPEQIIWKNEVMTGIINRKVVETQVITNLKVLQNDRAILLSDLDDILVMNQHRESQYQGGRYYIRGSGMSYGTGRSSGKTVGDVTFMYQGQPAIVFGKIQDPAGVVRLAKAARKSMIQQIKNAEKMEAKLSKQKEKELQSYTKMQSKQNRTIIQTTTLAANSDTINPNPSMQITCIKCGMSNPPDSNFCVKCGNTLSSTCSKCGRNNPSGSAFCNNCGFALS